MNPSPINIGIHVQEKLLRPGNSSQMAFSSHGPSGSVQSSVCGEKKGPMDFELAQVRNKVSDIKMLSKFSCCINDSFL